MNKKIMRNPITEKDGKYYNENGDEVVACISCGAPTTMTGTKYCDNCWNAKGFFNEEEKRILLHALDRYRNLPLNEHAVKILKIINKVKML